MTWLLLLPAALAGGIRFHPGVGPEWAEIAEDSTVGGMPVRRTGLLLARAEDPASLAADPDVLDVEVLGGDGHVARIRPRPGVDEVALSVRLRARPDVAWSHPDLVLPLRLHAWPDDPFAADQWHLENTGQSGWTPDVDVDADDAWAFATGAGGIVAVVDTGVQVDHPDLRVTAGWDYVGQDDDPSPDPEDDGGPHGTAAAGLAAATGGNGLGVAGVAHGAEVYAIRFVGAGTTLGDLYDAFVEATDAGAWVISNSWGFGDSCEEFPTYGSIQDAVDYAETVGRGGLGAAVVASAGNSNCDISGDGFLAHPAVVGVAAIHGWDGRESYSCYGDHVDLSAPSGGVLTTDLTGDAGYGSWSEDPDYYGWFSGTSASAPIVSGAFALLFEANPRLTAAQARDVLCDTAVRMDTDDGGYDEDGWSPWYGCGRIDAGAAVAAVADAPPPAPVPLAPGEDTWEDRVLLAWEPALDPDGDWLAYTVRWRVGDAEEVAEDAGAATWLDLTGRVEAGDTVTWRVAAVDGWGEGPSSEPATFHVARIPTRPEPASCATPAGRGATPAVLLAALALAFARPLPRRARPGRLARRP